MGTKERRQRERQDIQKRILDAARELFVEQGFENVSMRKIAERIEYSAPAIYFHFSDKQALLRALCETDFLTLAQTFVKIAKVTDPIERLRKIGLAYLDFSATHPNHYRLMFMTPHPAVTPEESKARKGVPEEDAYAFLRNTIEQGMAEGRFRSEYKDADLLTQIAWAGVHGVAALHLVMQCEGWVKLRPLRKTGATMIDVLIRGWTSPDPTPDQNPKLISAPIALPRPRK